MTKGSGKKFDSGKPAFELLPERASFEVARVFQHGREKYDTDGDDIYNNNWRKGMRWGRLIGAMMRHLFAFKQGENTDQESGLHHLAHVVASAMMLMEYQTIYPQGDDRAHNFLNRDAYVLDIDGVICDFLGGFYDLAKDMDVAKQHHGKKNHNYWNFPFDATEVWKQVDDDFWLNLPALVDGQHLPVEPYAYLTHRMCSTEVTERWLEDNHFPHADVYTVSNSKVDAAKEIISGTTRPVTFIDDRYKNFAELRDAGLHCLLYSRPYNEKYDVGPYRIHDLHELNQDQTYKQ